MTQSEPAGTETETAPRRRSKLLQWNIATLLLLMAAVGVWTLYFRMKSETKKLDAELPSLKEIARELVVSDPTEYAVVKQHEDWYGEDTWEVHLPEGSDYVLRMATREIDSNNLPATDHVAEVAAGRHIISLEKTFKGDDASAVAIVDGQVAIRVPEGEDWYQGDGHSSGGGFSRLGQLHLTRIRFQKPAADGGSDAGPEPYNGLFLWIDRK